MLGSISRRVFLAFTWIMALLVSQALLSILGQRLLVAEFRQVDRTISEGRAVMTALHGAHTEAAIVVGSRNPAVMDLHAARCRGHLDALERLAPGIGDLRVEPLKAAYGQALEHQYQFAFEMALQDLAAAVPLHDQAEARVSGFLRAAEATKSQAMRRTLRWNAAGAVVLVGLAVLVALVWASRLEGEFTDRRRAEASLAAAVKQLQNLLDAATQMAIIMTDPAGQVRVFNRGAELMLGWKAEEVVGRQTPLAWHDPAELEARRAELVALGFACEGPVAPLFEVPIRRDQERRHWTFVTRAGARRTVDLLVTRVHTSSDEILGFLGIGVDVTDQLATEASLRAQEEQLRQSQKMDSIGQLAGGVAHDFNNMLGAIRGGAELIEESLAPGDPRHTTMSVIVRAADRASDLTRKLLAFSRKGKLVSTPLDLHTVIQEMVQLLERSIDRRITIRLDLRCRRPMVVGDPSQLENALLNLCINARDAMPDGGNLTLATREEDLGAGGPLEPGPHVRVEVRDDGQGIPPELQERIFEPFFTTKAHGKGTGLGLAAVYGIVTDHHGRIEVASTPGRGTCFTIHLPLDRSGQLPEARPADRPRPGGSGTVLVIEDEELVRATATMLLQSLGYDTILAATGMEGVELFKAHRDRVKVVLLDMVMPGISGKETAHRLLELDPAVRIIVTSGFIKEQWAADLTGVGPKRFLHKPYGKAELAEALDLTLAE